MTLSQNEKCHIKIPAKGALFQRKRPETAMIYLAAGLPTEIESSGHPEREIR
jgi:hypothetical protein